MNAWLLAVVAVIYVGVAIDYYIKRDVGAALAFIAYAVANLGFIIQARGVRW